ncbi:MAG: hypothetical protein ACI4EA_10680 [Candidatus Ornithomonoglobus sp.]
MKRYENPIINVSLFDRENVVTEASQIPPAEPELTAVEQAINAANGAYGEGNVIKVTF